MSARGRKAHEQKTSASSGDSRRTLAIDVLELVAIHVARESNDGDAPVHVEHGRLVFRRAHADLERRLLRVFRVEQKEVYRLSERS